MPVIIVAVISTRWRRCDKAGDRPHGSPDRGTEGGPMTASSGSPDRGPTPRTDEASSNHPLEGIVWIGASRQADDKPDRDRAGNNPWFYHRYLRPTARLGGALRLSGCSRRMSGTPHSTPTFRGLPHRDATAMCHFWESACASDRNSMWLAEPAGALGFGRPIGFSTLSISPVSIAWTESTPIIGLA
jgi:hypothetical protein